MIYKFCLKKRNFIRAHIDIIWAHSFFHNYLYSKFIFYSSITSILLLISNAIIAIHQAGDITHMFYTREV